MNDIVTPARTKEILKQFNLTAKKSLGQNFIIDRNILLQMVHSAAIDRQTTVIEVGPGIGTLTEQLAKVAKRVFAFEIDQRMLDVLDTTLKSFDNVQVFHQDILQVDWEAFQEKYLIANEKVVVMANLPYYITTPILMNLFKSSLPFSEIVVMMQKEVAARLQAKPHTKEYGSLTIAVQRKMSVDILFEVPPTVFIPQPNVYSAVIGFKRKEVYPEVSDEAFFSRLVRACFVHRRKTLWNNLKSFYQNDIKSMEQVAYALAQASIDPKRRPETLTIDEFVQLSNLLSTVN
ncbi:16S rRNA (adenine(1518)-N(6)/adenine(1519)-N(6))-dimethyltransferase RsmA [Allofustis seminis]|uniref:16S rRNA (adenine(1518)-N(6)/adenine(1519)-N(6))- dimethyltransferase RsmA n=1 Tax=Allofustis seminis TaxID=166939 RepID=UPI00037CD076|nr:16S rRNA (adenine(1518)-N(6)/adenine(1519)-N(6))-dimethyltransferase RsmA [Allofustis seminis]